MIAESHKRRTVTRADISQAAGQSDMFDFLIDFLPPDERKTLSATGTARRPKGNATQSDDHKSSPPAVGSSRKVSSSKPVKTSRASSDAAQEVEQLVVC